MKRMKRAIVSQLGVWLNDPGRKPLILRGTRNVGKARIRWLKTAKDFFAP
jgi:hypothetical protein